MEHPPHLGIVQHNGQGIPVGLPVVDDDGQTQLNRQLNLPPEDRLLELLGRVVLPIVIQADLSHGHHLFVAAELPEGGKFRLARPGAVGRVDANGGIDKGIPLRQGQGGPGALQLTAGIYHQPNPGGREGGEDFVPVGGEPIGIIVGVGIKNRHGKAPPGKTKRTSERMPFWPDGLRAFTRKRQYPGSGDMLDQPIRLSFRVMALFL